MDDDSSTLGGDIAAAMTAAGDPPSSTPSTPEPSAASASADTISPPVDVTATEQKPSTGTPPEHRWPSILENARNEWKQQYGWAETINRDAVQQAQRIGELYMQDRPAYLRQVLQESLADATLAPLIRSELGRALAQGGRQAQPEQEPQPDLPIQLEDGRVVHLYSAGQQAKRDAWREQQLLGKIQEQYAPIVQSVEQVNAERAHLTKLTQANTFATTTFADIQTWKGMDAEENRKAVAEAIKAMNLQSDDPREVALAANIAYRQVVMPKLVNPTAQRQAVLNDIHQKAGVNTVSPTATSAGTPKSYADMSWGDAIKHELATRR